MVKEPDFWKKCLTTERNIPQPEQKVEQKNSDRTTGWVGRDSVKGNCLVMYRAVLYSCLDGKCLDETMDSNTEDYRLQEGKYKMTQRSGLLLPGMLKKQDNKQDNKLMRFGYYSFKTNGYVLYAHIAE